MSLSTHPVFFFCLSICSSKKKKIIAEDGDGDLVEAIEELPNDSTPEDNEFDEPEELEEEEEDIGAAEPELPAKRQKKTKWTSDSDCNYGVTYSVLLLLVYAVNLPLLMVIDPMHQVCIGERMKRMCVCVCVCVCDRMKQR